MSEQRANRSYQSHSEQEGMSDSRAKLKRLGLPMDLKGKSFLDLGCNEGFFCNVAVQRGASRVVGLDYVANNISVAKKLYGDRGIEFIHSSWHDLPAGDFDVILWSSAMHYDLKYNLMFPRILSQLAAGGTFILECGAVESSVAEMVAVKRHSDTLFYPSTRLLLAELGRVFDFRVVDLGTLAEGDPVPRSIFHCTKPFTSAYILSDNGSARGSYFRSLLAASGVKILGLERFCRCLGQKPYLHSELQRHVAENWSGGALEPLLQSLRSSGLIHEFVGTFLGTINPADRMVWIDLTGGSSLVDQVVDAMRGRAVIWNLGQVDSASGGR